MTYFISFLLISAALALAVAKLRLALWMVWPRLEHVRTMLNPEHQRQLRHLARQDKLELKRQALELERYAVETAQIARMIKLNKGQSVLIDGQQFFAPSVEGAQNVLPPPPDSLPELMPLLKECDNVLIIGKKGSGKSNLIRRILDTRIEAGEEAIVLDPHATPNQWGAAKVLGTGLDYATIESHLHDVAEKERSHRYRRLGQGQTEFLARTYFIDEMTEITSEIDVSLIVQRLLNCRKVKMKAVIGGHSPNSKDIGLDGRFNLVKNFDAHIRIDYTKSSNERRFWLCLDPAGHHDEFMEVANPGPYEPKVPPALPSPLNVPSMSAEPQTDGQPWGKHPDDYTEEQDKQIAWSILMGKSLSETRKAVFGSNATIGKRYKEIRVEMYPPQTKDLLFHLPQPEDQIQNGEIVH